MRAFCSEEPGQLYLENEDAYTFLALSGVLGLKGEDDLALLANIESVRITGMLLAKHWNLQLQPTTGEHVMQTAKLQMDCLNQINIRLPKVISKRLQKLWLAAGNDISAIKGFWRTQLEQTDYFKLY